jgi:hypothetical protein
MVDPDQSMIVLAHQPWLLYAVYSMGARNLSAFVITETDEKVIATVAIIGLNSQPVRGYSTPADNGIANALYRNANLSAFHDDSAYGPHRDAHNRLCQRGRIIDGVVPEYDGCDTCPQPPGSAPMRLILK